jgi:pantothenate synthetase
MQGTITSHHPLKTKEKHHARNLSDTVQRARSGAGCGARRAGRGGHAGRLDHHENQVSSPDHGGRQRDGHHVDTRAGVVTLFGMVHSQEARAAAEADAHTVSGVQSVVNDLQVVARAEQAAVQARDDELAQAVQTAFATPAFKDITVEVQNGVVRLTGTVPTGAQRLEAAVVARAIPGVRAVRDDLRLVTATP